MTLIVGQTVGPATAPVESRRGAAIWERQALAVLLIGSAVLYLWNLSVSGWANSFYAASAQAGSMSWKAWLFASLDPGNSITVDKPPAAMWVMGLSMRIFGVNSWALLVPEALMGVASVALLYAAVRRWSGPVAGLLAGAALALTPVAVLMFRYDNPDALLVLTLTAAAYTTVRAVESASWRWLALTGVLLGFGFLTKMMQAFLVLPGLALVYLVAAPTGIGRRIRQLLGAGAAVVVSAGWFVLLVSLWPASSRPYIAGSTNNSLWQLAIGYNGISRILGRNRGGGGHPTASGVGGVGGGGHTALRATALGGGHAIGANTPGIGRLFGAGFGPEISWLLPAALVALLGLSIGTWGRSRTDRTRAAAILWGGWVIVTGITLSFMSGTDHSYYSLVLAPGIAALVAIGARQFWVWRSPASADQPRPLLAHVALAAMLLATGIWNFVLLGRSTWAPGLRWFILLAGVLAAAAMLVPASLPRRALVVTTATIAVVAAGTGSAAWAIATDGSAHTGSSPEAGPATASATGNGSRTGRAQGNGRGTGKRGRNAGLPGRRGESDANPALVTLLEATTGNRWAAATNGSMQAAPLQLASGKSVMAIGGFSGSDPAPTLAQFQTYVRDGEVRYYLANGAGGTRRSGNRGPSISTWVSTHYTATIIGNTTVYDLTSPKPN
nr:glycosyltransferase family 39 protein [Actinoplanes subtropicus]